MVLLSGAQQCTCLKQLKVDGMSLCTKYFYRQQLSLSCSSTKVVAPWRAEIGPAQMEAAEGIVEVQHL